MQASLLVRSHLTRGVFLQATRFYATKGPKKPLASSSSNPAGQASTPPPPPEPLTQGAGPLPSLDISPLDEAEQPQRTGARSSKDSLSSHEKRRRFLGRVSVAALFFGAAVQTWYLGREWELDEIKDKRLKVSQAVDTRWGRTKHRFGNIFGFFTEPLWEDLLPPPLPATHQKPFTLLVSIDDLLVTSTWDRQHGWRTAKRPGVDYFLAYLAQFYEIVIFTTQYHYTAMPILEKLDPYQFFITYKLFRDATRTVNGTPVKDLTYLNRDLSKVILLDTHPEHVSPQPENAIILPPWKGDPNDKGLIAMIPFLESVGIYSPKDVRPILQAYHGKDIPLEYAQKEAEAKNKHTEEWERTHKGLSSGGMTLSALFSGSSSPAKSSPVPPTYLEQKRLEAQMHYREEQAYIKANKENFERLIKEEQDAMAREMPNTFWGAASALLGGAPPQGAPPPPSGSSSAATPTSPSIAPTTTPAQAKTGP